MANVYLQLPAPAGNGVGAWVDVSTMGFDKTIIVGNLPNAVINIEMSNEAIASKAAPVAVLASAGQKEVGNAALWMRAKVSGYSSGGAPVVFVGSNDDGAAGINLPAPAGNGVAAGVDVAAFGEIRTFTVGEDFSGNLTIEGSDDNVNFAPFLGFTQPGQKSLTFGSRYLRVRRAGVNGGTLPLVDMAAINDVSPGPGFLNPTIQRFTAAGGENDFNVVLTLPRLSDDYSVWATQAGMAAIVGIDMPDLVAGDRTLVQFRVITTAPLTAGDIIDFLIANR